MRHAQRYPRSCNGLVAVVILALAAPATAVDGVFEINQASAKAGNPAIGDATPDFPVTITSPGSYRLTSNLVVANAATNVVEISGDNVTLDLNGFTIQGPVTCGGTPILCTVVGGGPITGVGVVSSNFNVAVTNGTVRGLATGIRLNNGGRVERVHAAANVSFGILVTQTNMGASGIVRGNNAWGNAGVGIGAFASVVTENVANHNGGNGFNAGSCVLRDNVATANGGDGIEAGTSVLLANQASGNTGYGIQFLATSNAWGHNLLLGNTAGNVDGTPPQVDTNVCLNVPCP